LSKNNADLVADVKIEVTEKFVDGEIHFFSTVSGVTDDERELLEEVNLSRGGNKTYRLDQLSFHNGSGANWSNPSDGLHSNAAQFKYRERIRADLATAWSDSKAAIAADREVVEEECATPMNTSASVFFMANGV
jgi:hypothetical protein